MTKFEITRPWLVEMLSAANGAAEVVFPGDAARAVLSAAWKGMGYADTGAEVYDFVPSRNPNWLRYSQNQDKQTKGANATRPDLQVVKGDKD